MTDFLNIVLTPDAQTLVDNAIAQFTADLEAAGIVGYVPNEGNLEIILFNILGGWAADVNGIASQATAAIFRQFGTQLAAVQYESAAAATVTSTWTLTDTAGHTIPGGTYLTIGSYGFYVVNDVIVTPGPTTATVQLVAVQPGAAYNGLTAPVQLVDPLAWVASIVLVGATSGGVDQEQDPDFQNRLAAQLALQAPRPITAADYATFVLSVPTAILPTGVVIGRATSIDGYNPGVNTFTGTVANTSTTMTAVSSFTGVTAGTALSGVAIPAGTTVVSVNTGASTLVMSAAATGAHTAETITATGSYNNERTVTTFVTDPQGVAVSSPAMAAIAAWLQGFREANFQIYVVAPSYTPVYITFEVHVLPGYNAAAVVANVEQALLAFLNPLLWGNPNAATSAGGSSEWLNSASGFNVVRYNKVLGIIENVAGVDYVPSGSTGLAIGTTASPSGTADITLTGPAPLPQTDLTTPTIVGSSV